MLTDPFNYKRRPSSAVKIGNMYMGGQNPVRVQSMANTDTNDIEASVQQCIRTFDVGCELMRYTTQGIKEVESLHAIHAKLREQGYTIPLVADIHFNTSAAELAARYVEKVRINPGNFVGSIKKKNDPLDYTDQEYRQEYEILKSKFISFLHVCKDNNTAIRIGVNHGSLSERIMNRYGDTPEGMVESCMELLRVCRDEDFSNVVISMKTSNTVFMVYAVRLLVKEMEKEGFSYPLHLGVTEAGEGEDGRIKSAAGIGALLTDGIGDTIRVSLSEDPEREIPVAKALVSYFAQREGHLQIEAKKSELYDAYQYNRRKTRKIKNIGGDNVPVVIIPAERSDDIPADYFLKDNIIEDIDGNNYPVYTKNIINELRDKKDELLFLKLRYEELNAEVTDLLLSHHNIVILLDSAHINAAGEYRAFFHTLLEAGCEAPVVFYKSYNETDKGLFQIKSSADLGVMFIDGFGDGILLEDHDSFAPAVVSSVAFGILQATRTRVTKTEYISCPGCGRTLFDLQKVIADIKSKTSHLKGLKIAIMGCIVNGPGEMADADYGYIGAGRGKISLYKKKECIERNIPESEAVEKLLELIKSNENIPQ